MFPNLVTYACHHQPTLPPYDAQAYQYLLAGNGLFVRSHTRFWQAVIPLCIYPVRGLAPLQPQFHLLVPLLPASLLATVWQDARGCGDGNGRLCEALYHFHHQQQHIQVKRPSQQVSPVSVTTASIAGSDVILELHSHGAMAAFWSSTDTQDEQGCCIYGVIGRLSEARPEIRLRLGIYGHQYPLLLTQLFETPTPFLDRETFPLPCHPFNLWLIFEGGNS